MWSKHKMTLWLGVSQSHGTNKFGGHKHSSSRDNIIIFVCHVTLQDCMIRVLFDFMVRSPAR